MLYNINIYIYIYFFYNIYIYIIYHISYILYILYILDNWGGIPCVYTYMQFLFLLKGRLKASGARCLHA